MKLKSSHGNQATILMSLVWDFLLNFSSGPGAPLPSEQTNDQDFVNGIMYNHVGKLHRFETIHKPFI